MDSILKLKTNRNLTKRPGIKIKNFFFKKKETVEIPVNERTTLKFWMVRWEKRKKKKNKEDIGDTRLYRQQHVSPHMEGYIFNVAIKAII
jgi:hypothetical protein